MLSQILFVLGAASSVIAFGFIIGLSQNISINNELAKQTAYNYDSNLKLDNIIISDDKTAAIANSNKGFLLFKTVGNRIAIRIINDDNFIQRDNSIVFSLNDIGFPDFKAEFNNNDVCNFFDIANGRGIQNA